ncbi:MAG: hypothetical protein ACK6BN_12620 [Pseudanabaena sp.]
MIAPLKIKPISDRLSNPHNQRSPLKKINQTAIAPTNKLHHENQR